MTTSKIQYLDASRVLHEFLVNRQLNAREIERLQEYMQNPGSRIQNLPTGITRVGICLGPTSNLAHRTCDNHTPRQAVYHQGHDWRNLWYDERTAGNAFRVSSGNTAATLGDQLNRPSAEDAASVQNQGLSSNDITAAQENLPRESELHLSSHATKPLPASSEIARSKPSHPVSSDTSYMHEFGLKPGLRCPCKYPWTCNPLQPLPILNDGRFGPVGRGRPTPGRTRDPAPHNADPLLNSRAGRAGSMC